MTPQEYAEWLSTCSVEALLDQTIWESIMEGTAHCGWTKNARDGLFESVRDSVKWALIQKNILTPTSKESE